MSHIRHIRGRSILGSLVLILLLLSACGRNSIPVSSVSVSSCRKPATKASQATSNFLPLVAGNTWTYAKTVSDEVFSWEAYSPKNSTEVTLAIGAPPDLQVGKSAETYRITRIVQESGFEFAEVEVSSATARDGRYGAWYTKPDRILWGRVPSSEHLIEMDEVMIANATVFQDERRFQQILLAEPFESGVEATLQQLSAVKQVVSADLVDVTVPAGHFPCTLVVTTAVENQETKWLTYSFYALGVGLVKEVQQNSSGETTYDLELTQYTLN